MFSLAFNLMPIYGVMAEGWSLFSVVYLYWMETLILAVFSVVKIMTARGKEPKSSLIAKLDAMNPDGPKWKIALKFLFWRVAILLFYLLFIVVFVGFISARKGEGMLNLKLVLFMDPVFNLTLLLYSVSLAMDMVWHYFGNGEYLVNHPKDYASFIDARTIVMHVVIVLGAVGYVKVKDMYPDNIELAQLYFIGIFVIVKTLADLIVYYFKRKTEPSVNN